MREDSRPPCLQTRAHRKHESRKETSEKPHPRIVCMQSNRDLVEESEQIAASSDLKKIAEPVKREIDPARNPISRGCKTVMAC